MSDSLAADVVEPLLSGLFGRPYLYREVCESTQTVLRGDEDEGTTAVCDEQTAGRGRHGRGWIAPPRTSILCSVLLRPPKGRRLPELSLVGGLAAADLVEATLGQPASVKWPNDVVLVGCKVAGVLAEARGGAVVVGIGVNVNQLPGELPARAGLPAASLRTQDGVERARAPLLALLLETLERRYESWLDAGLAGLHSELEARDFLRGRRVSVGGLSGVAAGVDRAGRLVLDVDGVLRAVESGEVRLRP